MLKTIYHCSGVENYLRYLDGHRVGKQPFYHQMIDRLMRLRSMSTDNTRACTF